MKCETRLDFIIKIKKLKIFMNYCTIYYSNLNNKLENDY